jgi:hypothetical protein
MAVKAVMTSPAAAAIRGPTERLLEAVHSESLEEMERAFTEALRDGADFIQLPKSSRALTGLLLILPYCLEGNEKIVAGAIEEQLRSDIRLEKEGPFLEKIQERFRNAIILRKYEAVIFFLTAGLTLDFDIDGKSPLVFAITYSSPEIIRLIESEGSHMGEIALVIRERREPRADLVDVFPLSTQDLTYLNTKAVAHFYNIVGKLPDWNEELEGSYCHLMVPYLTEALEQFQSSELGEQRRVLIEATRGSCRPGRTNSELSEKISSGELCMIHSGWRGHAVTLCFFGGYMALCNRGSGSITRGTLKVFKIDLTKVSAETVRAIKSSEGVDSSRGAEILYDILPESLEGSQDPLTSSFTKVAPKWQKIGNCSLASPKGALRFAWIMLLRARGVENHFEVGLRESKAFTEFAARHLVEKHGNSIDPVLKTMTRFRAALWYKRWRSEVRNHTNPLLRGAGRVAGWVMSISLPILSIISSRGQA